MAAASASSDPIVQAKAIFDTVWEDIHTRGGTVALSYPKKVVWLGGAPGAGKGTHTLTVMQCLGITAAPVIMSGLLNSPEMRQIKDSGRLVQDADVLKALLNEMCRPIYRAGVVVDGFPRTRVQAECVRLLHERMKKLAVGRSGFAVPDFVLVVMHVTEDEAVGRQLGRGREIQEHNRKVQETGQGELLELRPTDVDEKLCRERYQVFVAQTMDALKFLASTFAYIQIDANGAKEQTRANILRAFGKGG